MIEKPDFLQKGAIVKVQHWYGEIIDIALSDTKIMVLVVSPKGIWRNHPEEWLEYKEGQIIPLDDIDFSIESVQIYLDRVQDMYRSIVDLRSRWSRKLS